MSKSSPRDALTDMVSSLKGVFNKYDRSSRKKAWKAIGSPQGKKEMNQLLDSPTRPVTGVSKWLSFKEWINKTNS
jgi:hypothetical protein